jgi:hypothetical protein
MASEVTICNLALSHLGDSATVASIDPPEGSAQAEHCAIFYPIARDILLESHAWNFATVRATLAELVADSHEWTYAYAAPNALKVLAIMPPVSSSDGTPQPYEMEVSAAGARVILTDQPGAVARYIIRVTDTSQFSPLFVLTHSWLLASMLAGPILKGDAGAAEAKRCEAMAQFYLSKAKESDSNQRNHKPMHTPGWISGR